MRTVTANKRPARPSWAMPETFRDAPTHVRDAGRLAVRRACAASPGTALRWRSACLPAVRGGCARRGRGARRRSSAPRSGPRAGRCARRARRPEPRRRGRAGGRQEVPRAAGRVEARPTRSAARPTSKGRSLEPTPERAAPAGGCIGDRWGGRWSVPGRGAVRRASPAAAPYGPGCCGPYPGGGAASSPGHSPAAERRTSRAGVAPGGPSRSDAPTKPLSQSIPIAAPPRQRSIHGAGGVAEGRGACVPQDVAAVSRWPAPPRAGSARRAPAP